jgi:hypothetical protein
MNQGRRPAASAARASRIATIWREGVNEPRGEEPVVGDIRQKALDEPPKAEIYYPFSQHSHPLCADGALGEVAQAGQVVENNLRVSHLCQTADNTERGEKKPLRNQGSSFPCTARIQSNEPYAAHLNKLCSATKDLILAAISSRNCRNGAMRSSSAVTAAAGSSKDQCRYRAIPEKRGQPSLDESQTVIA